MQSLKKGFFDPNYALVYTILDFKTKLRVKWDKDNKDDLDYLKKKFDLFAAAYRAWLPLRGLFV